MYKRVLIASQHVQDAERNIDLPCLSVCPSPYCILSKRMNISSNCFHRSFLSQNAVTEFQRKSTNRALDTREWERLAILDPSRRLSRKRYEIDPWLLWITNRKSQVTDRSVSRPISVSDLERRDAKGQYFFRPIFVRSYRFTQNDQFFTATQAGSGVFLWVSHASSPMLQDSSSPKLFSGAPTCAHMV